MAKRGKRKTKKDTQLQQLMEKVDPTEKRMSKYGAYMRCIGHKYTSTKDECLRHTARSKARRIDGKKQRN